MSLQAWHVTGKVSHHLPVTGEAVHHLCLSQTSLLKYNKNVVVSVVPINLIFSGFKLKTHRWWSNTQGTQPCPSLSLGPLLLFTQTYTHVSTVYTYKLYSAIELHDALSKITTQRISAGAPSQNSQTWLHSVSGCNVVKSGQHRPSQTAAEGRIAEFLWKISAA